MTRSRLRLGAALVAALALLTMTATPASAGVGGTGSGDPFFPRAGNGGYQVSHYDLRLTWHPKSDLLGGIALINAHARKRMTSFDLDLRRSLRVSKVYVDAEVASFAQPASLGQELVITPRHPVAKGRWFTVSVHYRGVPTPVTDPDGSLEGWITTDDGAVAVGEPQGSPGWFPCNDTPRDKATYDIRLRVPQRLQVVSNGDLLSTKTFDGWTRFHWSNQEPTATYLTTAAVGSFDITTGTTPGGVPYYVAVDPQLAAKSATVVAKLPAVTDYLATLYGPYPFRSTGVIVDHAPKLGYALETQTRPIYDSPPDTATLVHEAAHMYFGDSVTLKQWPDIWLAEGFAEFSSWMWSEHVGGRTAQEKFDHFYAKKATSPIWEPPPNRVGKPANLFADSVYERGAMTLQALRVKIGNDDAFFGLLRAWHAAHRHSNATVAGFEKFAATYTGKDLDHFFHVWLEKRAKPRTW